MSGYSENSFESSDSTEHLVSDDSTGANDDGQSLEARAVRKLQCFICMLILIVVGFVTSLNEAKVFYMTHGTQQNASHLPWYMYDSPTDWVCWFIKCTQVSMAICAFIYLQKCVVLPGKIPKTSFCNPNDPQKKFFLMNVHRCLELPKNLANYPSKLFISIFIIFAALGVACGILETVGGILDSADPEILKLIPYVEVLRCLLLIVFIVMQTAFFVKHNRACIQWRLNGVWLAVSIIIATNISAWFFYVELEIRDIVTDRDYNKLHNWTAIHSTAREGLESATQILFPFLIEFFIMSAIVSAGFLSNAGRLGSVLQQRLGSGNWLTRAGIKQLLRPKRSQPGGGYLRQHRRSLAFGLALVLAALAASTIMKVFSWSDRTANVILNFLLVVLSVCGIGCTTALLRAFKSKSEKLHVSDARTADRMLLWCGVVAIVLNDTYRFVNCFSANYKDWYSSLDTSAVTLPNICQCIMQVYVLECILVRRFQPTVQLGNHRGVKLLTVLMLINAAEWLISSVAFNLFFVNSRGDQINTVIAIATMPLQVFFRFHSIGCIHEFKKHCKEAHDAPVPAESVTIEFPSLLQRSYGSVL